MKHIYLSGKMTGLKDYGKEDFEKAEVFLNYVLPYEKEILNPYKLANYYANMTGRSLEDIPRSEYLKFDISKLINCTDIALLPNFKDSSGALLELSNAMEFDIKECYLTEPMLNNIDNINKLLGEKMYKTKIEVLSSTTIDKIDRVLVDVILPYYGSFKDNKVAIEGILYDIVTAGVNYETNTQFLKVVESNKVENTKKEDDSLTKTTSLRNHFKEFDELLEKEAKEEQIEIIFNERETTNLNDITKDSSKFNKNIKDIIEKVAYRMSEDYIMSTIDYYKDPYHYFERRLNKFVAKLIKKEIIN